MMNKRIRSMIDDIFSEMKMTAENLALRDEMMANAQARYEDNLAQGRSEEEAFAEVAESLGDVSDLLREMNGAQQEAPKEEPQKADPKIEVKINLTDEPSEDEEHEDDDEETEEHEGDEDAHSESGAQNEINLGDALNKAFCALGGFGKSIMPQAKKLVRDMDEATGGAIRSFGKALGDSVKTAQKAAGDAFDRMGDEHGEIVIDLTKPAGAKKSEETEEKTAGQLREEAAKLREEAADLRAQAQIKLAVGDQESADALLAQADALDIQTDAISMQADALEQAEAMEQAQAEAAQEDAQEEACGANACGADVVVSGSTSFPVAGLRKVDIQLDADDVVIEPAQGNEITVSWEGRGGDPDVRMENHKLIIRHKNPDVFKTFFSFFKKDGGEFVIKVPLGYAADYAVSTTSGDIRLSGVDVDNVKLGTASGDMRVEPDLAIRAKKIATETVSGDVTVSARCEDVAAEAVSGDLFISCDAKKVSVNSVSGDVHVEGACDEWEIETVNSDVDLLCTVAPTRKMDISNINGDVHIALPGDIRGFVAELSSVNGHIENEFGPNRYGTCALPIHMDTVNGNLLITRL